jgi:hypothetical protein
MDYRQYDNTIGRFSSIDPLAEKTPSISGYAFANNNPVLFNDPRGLSAIQRNGGLDQEGRQRFDENGIYIPPNDRAPGEPFDMFNYMDGGDGYGNFALGVGTTSTEVSGGTWYRTFLGNQEIVGMFPNQSNLLDADITPMYGYEFVPKKAGKFDGYNFADGTGQIMNAGGVAWGASEIGLKMLRQGTFVSGVSHAFGIGTQVGAQRLQAFGKTLGVWGQRLGTAGMVLSTVSFIAKGLDPSQTITAADHANFWIGAALYGAAAVIGGPIVGTIALVYGGTQLISYATTGKNLEQNILGE